MSVKNTGVNLLDGGHKQQVIFERIMKMRKIICGRLYDTDTAECVSEYSYSNPRDFKHYTEKLYRKRNGEFFLYGSGGPRSPYAEPLGNNSWIEGKNILALDKDEAKDWVEEKGTVEEYIALFGMPEE